MNTALPTPQVLSRIVKLVQVPAFEIEIDGKKVGGTFRVESEWEEFIKLTCDGPCARIVLRKPHVPHINIHDLVPKIFGGNRESNKPLQIECEQVGGDLRAPK